MSLPEVQYYPNKAYPGSRGNSTTSLLYDPKISYMLNSSDKKDLTDGELLSLLENDDRQFDIRQIRVSYYGETGDYILDSEEMYDE
ncbi:hypothetical protein JTB14_009237 [Gonioctena quinquepunctata]|nr:hypothetical protein JTB14_009237 [Gonioctena quinquepunctata]